MRDEGLEWWPGACLLRSLFLLNPAGKARDYIETFDDFHVNDSDQRLPSVASPPVDIAALVSLIRDPSSSTTCMVTHCKTHFRGSLLHLGAFIP